MGVFGGGDYQEVLDVLTAVGKKLVLFWLICSTFQRGEAGRGGGLGVRSHWLF